MTYNLVALDSRIRATITTLNSEALRLHGRRNELTEEGLRNQWKAVAERHTPAVEEIAREVAEAAAALEKVEEYEVENLLPTAPATGLTAAQELTIARVLNRPGAYEVEALPTVIRPYLGTVIAGVIVEEIKLRNESITDEVVASVLARESVLYSDAVKAVREGQTIIGILSQGLQAVRHALSFDNVNGHEVTAAARPGAYLPSLQKTYGEDVRFSLSADGNIYA